MTAAADVYELVLYDTTSPASWFRDLIRRVRRIEPDAGGVVISVVHTNTGEELFRHIEDGDDDEDHLLHGIQQDLASMTEDEFAATWGR